MFCPYCSNAETKVLESRLIEDSVRRRRECLNCSNRFTTYEKAFFDLKVLKKDLRIEDFDLNKISLSLEKAFAKTNDQLVSNLAKKIEQKLLAKKNNPLKTSLIGNLILLELKKIDKIACLRYASVYKSIEDPHLLQKELQQLAITKR